MQICNECTREKRAVWEGTAFLSKGTVHVHVHKNMRLLVAAIMCQVLAAVNDMTTVAGLLTVGLRR